MRIIAGRWKGHGLKPLRAKGVRPTTDRVREAWMSALGERVRDATVLDLFAGSGALGLEALSRGARSVVFVERGRAALAVLRANVEHLGAEEESTVADRDVFRFLADPREVFDLAFADPPYADGSSQRLVDRWVDSPFARALWLEHPWREQLRLPEGSKTRRYGDTALSTLTVPDR